VSSTEELINQKLSELISSRPASAHALLFEAARYSILGSGKRLRPLLAITTAEAYGCPLDKILNPACALEMVHTYSLIHDDLPCMDNDDLRRGKPTLHKAYPEGQAVLAGDFLLTFAFQILCESPGLNADEKIELALTLSRAAGADGMIGGQVVDLASEGKIINWQTLHFMHQNKTAALLTASLEFGAIVGGAPKEDRALLQTIGQKLGLAFQIHDDLSDEENSDEKQLKATAVTLLGRAAAQKMTEELRTSVLIAIDDLSCPAPSLKLIIEGMI
jgi:geranylgeranyl diphosphate synthase, type II